MRKHSYSNPLIASLVPDSERAKQRARKPPTPVSVNMSGDIRVIRLEDGRIDIAFYNQDGYLVGAFRLPPSKALELAVGVLEQAKA